MGRVLADQELSHLENESGRDKDTTMECGILEKIGLR